MKITFYELLGLVKDGKAPKKIKFGNIELEYSEENEDYYSYYGGGLFEFKFGNCKNFLNDVVEIIEEPKKIKKCKNYEDFLEIDDYIEHIKNKINELLDKMQELQRSDSND